jgi:hypothetical protein
MYDNETWDGLGATEWILNFMYYTPKTVLG